MAKSNSTPTLANIEKVEMLLAQCGCYAETIQRLGNLIVEAGGSDECAVKDREHLTSSIIHLASLIQFLKSEAEHILDGRPETKPSTVALFVGNQYLKAEAANG